MRKSTRNYLVTLAQAIAAILLIVSAILLWFVFPSGFFASRDVWVDIHKGAGLALSILVLLHVVLHWGWLVQMTKQNLTSLWKLSRHTAASLAGRRTKG